MLEELEVLFKEGGLGRVVSEHERRWRMMAASISYFGGMVAIRPGQEPLHSEGLPQPDFVIQIPYYHEAVSSLLEQKEILENRFGLNPLRIYMLLLKSALEKAQSPNLLARALVEGLEREGT